MRKNTPTDNREIEDLMLYGFSITEVVEMGYPRTRVKYRRQELARAGSLNGVRGYHKKERPIGKYDDAGEGGPLIPPASRLQLARPLIESRFSDTPGWTWEWWINTPAGRERLRGMP